MMYIYSNMAVFGCFVSGETLCSGLEKYLNSSLFFEQATGNFCKIVYNS